MKFKNIRKKYHELIRKIACYNGATFSESIIRKNPFGKRYAKFITTYCAVTGELIREEAYIQDATEIRKDIGGLCRKI